MNQARNETQQNRTEIQTEYLSMMSELGLIWGEAALTGEEKFGLYNPPDMMIACLMPPDRSSSQKESASLTYLAAAAAAAS